MDGNGNGGVCVCVFARGGSSGGEKSNGKESTSISIASCSPRIGMTYRCALGRTRRLLALPLARERAHVREEAKRGESDVGSEALLLTLYPCNFHNIGYVSTRQ